VSRQLAPLALLVLAGCAFEPAGAVPFEPPPSYRAMWDRAQACSGRTRPIERVHFYRLEGHDFHTPQGDAAGYSRTGEVWLAEDFLDHPMVVRHEMLHALGVGGHPARPFDDPCRATWSSWDRAEPFLELPAELSR
jgi:hypothetical protein